MLYKLIPRSNYIFADENHNATFKCLLCNLEFNEKQIKFVIEEFENRSDRYFANFVCINEACQNIILLNNESNLYQKDFYLVEEKGPDEWFRPADAMSDKKKINYVYPS